MTSDVMVQNNRVNFRLFGTLFNRLGIGVSAIAISLVIVVAFGHFAINYMLSDVASTNVMGRGKAGYTMAHLIERLSQNNSGMEAEEIKDRVRALIADADKAIDIGLNGDEELGVVPVANDKIVASALETANFWKQELRPLLLQGLSAAEDDSPRSMPNMERLYTAVQQYNMSLATTIDHIREHVVAKIKYTRLIQFAISCTALFLLLIVMLMVRDITRRTRALAKTADKIAEGNLSLEAPAEGDDELSRLGQSFNAMTKKLAGMIANERSDKSKLQQLIATMSTTAQNLAEASSELRESASQQGDVMGEQSNVVTKTVSSVREVLATADEASKQAMAVAKSSASAAEISGSGRQALEESVSAMTQVKESSDAIGKSIQSLSEDGKLIEEIVTVVTDIADQTNMLALNAAIEASRAGEHGRGFSVVAQEIRSLAEKSKSGTSQVQGILRKISKSTNDAVQLTNEGMASVSHALKTVEQADNTIRRLEVIISESAILVDGISATSAQQATEMMEIQYAMDYISKVSEENLLATKKTENTAGKLNEIGEHLKQLASVTGED